MVPELVTKSRSVRISQSVNVMDHSYTPGIAIAARPIDEGLYRRFADRCATLPMAFDLVLPGGTSRRLGTGVRTFSLVLRDENALRALASLDQNTVAEAYFAGAFEIEGDLLGALKIRGVLIDRHPWLAAWRAIQPRLLGQSRLNKQVISRHYDRDPSFFLQFLDRTVPIYTQAMYRSDDEPFSDAAERKFAYCFDRLRLKPGDRLLEVGPGWGAWLKYASDRGVKCTGISISRYSIDYLRGIARQERYDWELIYADLLEYTPDRKYDAIVIMGIIEHLPRYDLVLRRLMAALRPGGRIFLDGASQTNTKDFSSVIIKHIFPGNHKLLILHEFLKAVADTPLRVEEVFDDRHSYYLTFRQWALNLERNRAAVVERFGELDYRKFRLYLWGFSHNMAVANSGCHRMILHNPEREICNASRLPS